MFELMSECSDCRPYISFATSVHGLSSNVYITPKICGLSTVGWSATVIWSVINMHDLPPVHIVFQHYFKSAVSMHNLSHVRKP